MLNILEKNIDMFEKAVMQPLSTEEATDMNGGWCLILMCSINFSTILGPIFDKEDPDKVIVA